jgi:hypothetical protein
MRVISVFRSDVDKICALLGYYAADVSGQIIGTIFKGQEIQEESRIS